MAGSITIKKLTKEKVAETADILLRSFKEESFTKAWLDLSSEKMWDAYYKASKIKIELSLEAGQPMYIAEDNGQVIGFIFFDIAKININKKKMAGYLLKNIPMIVTLLPAFIKVFRMGSRAMAPPGDLPANHYNLAAIGVDPDHQGRKVGRQLLTFIHDMCREDKQASGIYLFTGDEHNKDIYEKFGYKMIETRNTDGFVSYHMFWEKTAS